MSEYTDKTDTGSGEAIPNEVAFHFIKSPDHRTVHVEGAWGGITPRGRIYMSVYSERNPIPRKVVHRIGEDGRLGEEVEGERVSREGIVREVGVTLSMNLSTAQSVLKWLNDKVELLKQSEPSGQQP